MKTTLTELLEWICFIEHKYGGDGISHIKTKATELLEAEKEMIKDAFRAANTGLQGAQDAEEYYNDKFNN